MRSDPRALHEYLEGEDMSEYGQELFQGTPSSGNRDSNSTRQSHGRNRNVVSLGPSSTDDSSLLTTGDSTSLYSSSRPYFNPRPPLHNPSGSYPVPFNTSQYTSHATLGQASRQIIHNPLDSLTNYPTSTETRSGNPYADHAQQSSSSDSFANGLLDPSDLYTDALAEPFDESSYLFAAGFPCFDDDDDDNYNLESYVDFTDSTGDQDPVRSSDKISDPSANRTGNPRINAGAQPSLNDTAPLSVDDVRRVTSRTIETAHVSNDQQSSSNNTASDDVGHATEPLRRGSAPARSLHANVSPLPPEAWQFIASDADDQPLILQQTRAETRDLRASSAPPSAKITEQINNTIAPDTTSTAEVQPNVSLAVPQPTNGQPAANGPSSTNVGATTSTQPSLTAEDFANFVHSGGFQTNGRPPPNAQLSANVPQSMAAQITSKDIAVSEAFSHLANLEGQVAQCQSTIRKVKSALERTTQVDTRPLMKNTSSIDLSRDPRREAKARLAAQNASGNARSRSHVNPANIHSGSGLASSGTSQLNIGQPSKPGTAGDPRRSLQSQISSFVNPNLYQYSLGNSFDQSYTSLPSDLNYPSYQGIQEDLPAFSPVSVAHASTMNPRSSRPSRTPNPGITTAAGDIGSFSRSSHAPVRGSGDNFSAGHRRSLSYLKSLGAGPGEVSASRRSSTRDRGREGVAGSGQPFPSSLQPRKSRIKPSANARPSAGSPTSDFFSGLDELDDDRLSAHPPTSHPTRQTPTNQIVGSRRRSSLRDQVAAFDNSAPRARATVSSRSNGPAEAIEGMLPGAGSERLLGHQRVGLPKGDVNGLPYSCEAKCGYCDYAVREMINCDSAFHRKQPHLKRPDGQSGERGWYHPVCGGLPSENFHSSNWICPSCVSNGRTSTDDHDYDEGGDSDHDERSAPGGGEDSEDDYQPGHDNSDDDGDDDDGGNDDEDNENYTNDRGRRNKGRNSNKSGNRKRYASFGQGDEGENDDNIDDQAEDAAGFQHNPEEGSESDHDNYYVLNTDDGSDPEEPEIPTAKGDPWSEYEKALAVYYYRKVDGEKIHKGEARFGEAARLMRLKGYNRNLIAVKNMWNRCLRERSGLDERRNKRAPLRTSRQDKETKRKNREKKEKARLAALTASKTNQTSANTRSVSSKREYESDDEDEVIPPKRRRASPYDGDRFPGLS